MYTLFHGTTKQSAKFIAEHGFKLEPTRCARIFGTGAYLAFTPDGAVYWIKRMRIPLKQAAVVKVQVRFRNPLIIDTFAEYDRVLSAPFHSGNYKNFDQFMQEYYGGVYDGLVINDFPCKGYRKMQRFIFGIGGEQVVVYDLSRIKVKEIIEL